MQPTVVNAELSSADAGKNKETAMLTPSVSTSTPCWTPSLMACNALWEILPICLG